MNHIIRPIHKNETMLLVDFLYEAIYQPDRTRLLPRTVIQHPDLWIYIDGFGSQKGDLCLVAEVDKTIVGAVWTRLIHACGFIDEHTPELAISEAEKEVVHFGKIMQKDLGYIKEAVGASDSSDSFAPWRDKLVKYEEISDRIEYEVINFLNRINREGLGDESSLRIKSIYRIVGEMESLGDSGEAISRLIGRALERGQVLSEEHKKGADDMITLVARAYDAMIYNSENAVTIKNIDNAVAAEVDINAKRDALREKELARVENDGEQYFESVYYLSLIEELEKMGDFIINISQSIMTWRTA